MTDESIQLRNKCLKIGEQAWINNDKDKAIRMLEKSLRFGHTTQAETFLAMVKEGKEHPSLAETQRQSSTQSNSQNQSNNTSQNSNSNQTQNASNVNNNGDAPTERTWTPEQKTMADRINKCKTYYQILQLNQNDATESNIKKAYRKLALKMHPDKNAAPGANEAFKKLGAAYAVLSDTDKKRQYDLTDLDITKSNETANPTVRRRGGATYQRGGFQYHEFDQFDHAEDIFNLFFGGGMGGLGGHRMQRGAQFHTQRMRRERQQHRNDGGHYEDERGTNMAAFIQLAPLLLIMLMSLLTNLLTPDPPYSLNYTSDYRIKRFTDDLSVPYYTLKNFDKKYPSKNKDYNNLMHQIEVDYKDRLRNACYHEQQNKETLIRKGQFFRDHRMVERGKNMKLENCKLLEDLRAKESKRKWG